MSKNNEQFWRIENNTTINETTNEATLYIYGDIMQRDLEIYNWPDDVIPHRFRQELDALTNATTIHVRINSGGGSVFGAYAIMNLLKSHKAKIITYNDGIAASAATIIAMAGDKIVSALGSIWMIHLPLTYVTGNVNDLQKATEILNTITESMLDVYHNKTGIERAGLLEMMKSDTWMTGKEAKDKGFVDEVTDLEVVAYLNRDKATAFFNGLDIKLDKVHNIKALESIVGSAPITQETQEDIMNITDLQTKHQDIYNDVMQLDIQTERARIQAIDALSLPGLEELTNKAKFETGITAEALAVELIKAQKEKGLEYLVQAKNDAAHTADILAAGAPLDNTEQEEALLAHLADEAKNLK